jgi:hypothetical protein
LLVRINLHGLGGILYGSRPSESRKRGLKMAYEVEGQLLEVCTCNILCPCWVGEDPDNGTCDGLLGWHVTKGRIDGRPLLERGDKRRY